MLKLISIICAGVVLSGPALAKSDDRYIPPSLLDNTVVIGIPDIAMPKEKAISLRADLHREAYKVIFRKNLPQMDFHWENSAKAEGEPIYVEIDFVRDEAEGVAFSGYAMTGLSKQTVKFFARVGRDSFAYWLGPEAAVERSNAGGFPMEVSCSFYLDSKIMPTRGMRRPSPVQGF